MPNTFQTKSHHKPLLTQTNDDKAINAPYIFKISVCGHLKEKLLTHYCRFKHDGNTKVPQPKLYSLMMDQIGVIFRQDAKQSVDAYIVTFDLATGVTEDTLKKLIESSTDKDTSVPIILVGHNHSLSDEQYERVRQNLDTVLKQYHYIESDGTTNIKLTFEQAVELALEKNTSLHADYEHAKQFISELKKFTQSIKWSTRHRPAFFDRLKISKTSEDFKYARNILAHIAQNKPIEMVLEEMPPRQDVHSKQLKSIIDKAKTYYTKHRQTELGIRTRRQGCPILI